jgi:hypothetical protein
MANRRPRPVPDRPNRYSLRRPTAPPTARPVPFLLLSNDRRYDTEARLASTVSPDAPMTDYPNSTSIRLCAATGRPLRPGDRYYGVLALDGSRFIRQEYSTEGWAGPPQGAFGHWAGRVPTSLDAQRRPPIDDEMLVDCFQRLDGAAEPEKLNFRYVVALLLMRRKRFKFDDVMKDASGESLVVRDTRSGVKHTVVDPGLTEEQMKGAQDEVFQVLGWN